MNEESEFDDDPKPVDCPYKKGDRVGHKHAPELAFEVTDVDADTDGYILTVKSLVTRSTRTFSYDPYGSAECHTDLIGPPPAKAILTPGQVEKALLDNHDRMARQTFAGFHLVGGHRQVGAHTRRWFFTGERSNNCCFHLVTWPGYLVVTGDVGDCLWSRTEDMLSWADRNIDDRSYLRSKTPSPMRKDEYSAEIAAAVVDEKMAEAMEELLFDTPEGDRGAGPPEILLADLKDRYGRLRELTWNEFEFQQAAVDFEWVYDDPPGMRVTPNNYLWCHSALRAGLEVLGYLDKDITLPKPERDRG